MELFIQNIIAYPTSIFSGMLLIVILYWIVAAMGLLEIDVLDVDGAADVGGDISGAGPDTGIDMSDAGDFGDTGDAGAEHSVGALAVLLTKLGLSGVPLTIVLTFITLFGWITTYFCVHRVLRFMEYDLSRYGLGTVFFFGALALGIFLTSIIIRPLRKLFAIMNTTTTAYSLAGKIVEVRSPSVTSEKGEAIYEDGGAGLILQVRVSQENQELKRGDKAIIISYLATTHSYVVMGQQEVLGKNA